MMPVEAHQCYVDLSNAVVSVGGTATWSVIKGNPYIQHVRNRFVADFMSRPDCTEMVLVDDDLSWAYGDAARLLQHSTDIDIVGGVYPKRSNDLQFTAEPENPGEEPDANGLLPMAYMPTGFLRISRRAIETLLNAYPHLMYAEDSRKDAKILCALFWLEIHPNEAGVPTMMGEDVAFCKKWRDLGGKVYADTRLTFNHHGMTNWHGRYDDYLRAQKKLVAAE
jgi:hypothetical protein